MRFYVLTAIATTPAGLLGSEWFDLTDWEWWALLGAVVWYGAVLRWRDGRQ